MSAIKDFAVRVCPLGGGPSKMLTIAAATPEIAKTKAEEFDGRKWTVIEEPVLKRFA